MNYRYEIKVPISKYNEIIFHNWFLTLRNIRVHNPPREINNIYFDNLSHLPRRTILMEFQKELSLELDGMRKIQY